MGEATFSRSARARTMLAEEPFRFFFPLGMTAGLAGVALWPLHFAGLAEFYPGTSHARLMAHGFFGGFIFGFLGTAFPRMLSAPRLSGIEAGLVGGLYAAMAGCHVAGWTQWGDRGFALLLLVFALCLGWRFARRKDLPPPGFILVLLAFACGGVGTALSEWEQHRELPFFWLSIRPLLYYQGFVLLPILGVGGFILPRFFGLPSHHDLPESPSLTKPWVVRAVWSGVVGAAVLVSFVLEARGWLRAGPALRLAVCAGWLWHELPLHRASWKLNGLAAGLRLAVVLLILGFLSEVIFPAYRVAMLHLVLMGSFGVITLSVATRVVFGHSGQAARLNARNRWFRVVVWLMLLGMATRVSGDLWPKIMKSHYIYGALIWIAGLAVWAWHVLPGLAKPDPDARPNTPSAPT